MDPGWDEWSKTSGKSCGVDLGGSPLPRDIGLRTQCITEIASALGERSGALQIVWHACPSSCGLADEPLEPNAQSREIVRDGLPDDVQVHAEVLMNQEDVPHGGDIGPRDAGRRAS